MGRARRKWDDEDEGRNRRPSIGEWLDGEMDDEAPRRARRRPPEEDRRFDAVTDAISMLEERLDSVAHAVPASRSRRTRRPADDTDIHELVAQITNQQDALDTHYEGQNLAAVQRLQNQVRDLRAVVDAATRTSALPGVAGDIAQLAQRLGLAQQQAAPGNSPGHGASTAFNASLDQQLQALNQRLGLGSGQALVPMPDANLLAVHQQLAELNQRLPLTPQDGDNQNIAGLRREIQNLRGLVRPPNDSRAVQALEAEVRALSRKLGDGGPLRMGREIQELRGRLEHVGRAVQDSGFSPNNSFLNAQLKQLNESIGRVQRPVLPDRLVEDVRVQLADATRKLVPLSINDAKTLEKSIQFLGERLDSLRARTPDNARLHSLESHVGRLSEQLSSADKLSGGLQRLEQSLMAVLTRLPADGGSVNAFDPKTAGVLRGFQKQIEDVKAASEASDKRLHTALQAIQDVVIKIGERPAAAPADEAAASKGFGQRDQKAPPPKSPVAAAREAAARAAELQDEDAPPPRLEKRLSAARAAAKATKALEASFASALPAAQKQNEAAQASQDLDMALRAEPRGHFSASIEAALNSQNDNRARSSGLRRAGTAAFLAAAGLVLVIGAYNMISPIISAPAARDTLAAAFQDFPAQPALPKSGGGGGDSIGAGSNANYIPQVPGLQDAAQDQQTAALQTNLTPGALQIDLPPFPEGLNSTKLRIGAQNGDARALYEIGNRLIDGRGGVKTDPAQAIAWLRLAAERKHAPSLYRLATVFQKGKGVEKNVKQALAYYGQAGELGNRRSLHNLAALYAAGVDGSPSYDKAFSYFKRAAEMGLVDSQYNLGVLYVNGTGTKASLSEAYKWFAIAAQAGDAEAGKKRDEIGAKFDGKTLVAARLAAQSFKPESFDPAANEEVIPAGTWDDTATSSIGGMPGVAAGDMAGAPFTAPASAPKSASAKR